MRPAPTRAQSLGLRMRPCLPGNRTPAPWEDRLPGQRASAAPPVSPETGLFLVAVRAVPLASTCSLNCLRGVDGGSSRDPSLGPLACSAALASGS